MSLPYISATREIQFDAAHRVPYHGSKCKHMHGHRYKVILSMTCTSLGKVGSPEDGMVMDFGIMKQVLETYVSTPADHATLLYVGDAILPELLRVDPVRTGMAQAGRLFPYDGDGMVEQLKKVLATPEGENLSVSTFMGRVVVLPIIPTAENLAAYWGAILAREIERRTEQRAWVESVTVFETPNCTAEALFGQDYWHNVLGNG
jgi:6-pyruvoyltetrahydropterin/6-carboxytetrahydropterin synthase